MRGALAAAVDHATVWKEEGRQALGSVSGADWPETAEIVACENVAYLAIFGPLCAVWRGARASARPRCLPSSWRETLPQYGFVRTYPAVPSGNVCMMTWAVPLHVFANPLRPSDAHVLPGQVSATAPR